MYRYSAVTSSWISVASPAYSYDSEVETGYAIGGKGYVRSAYGLLTYTPSSNSWQINYDPDPIGYRAYTVAAEVGNKIYFGAGEYGDWWEFDPSFE